MYSARYWLKYGVHSIVELSGAPKRQRQKLNGKLVVFTYHSFCSRRTEGIGSSLPVSHFAGHLRFLKKYFQIVPLGDGLKKVLHGERQDKPLAAITIDDGFLDNYLYAWPLLEKMEIPATIFLATDFLDTGRPPWPTQLVSLFRHTREEVLNDLVECRLDREKDRSAAIRRFKNELKRLEPDDRFAILDRLGAKLRVSPSGYPKPLRWDHVREMYRGGVQFGSHTVYHSILTSMPEEIIKVEAWESKTRLESELQCDCEFFAYPNGDHNGVSQKILEHAGYLGAVTQDFGVNDRQSVTMALKRVEIPFHDPLPTFRCRASLTLPPRDFRFQGER